ncbi:CGNR zinc finger domain-containing protein [Allorhizocola rhizosphaerae]|uniref:CGNR zinc finger domain-containing protein n=1 Tax=Allorhizocola rhizosphaerae TaxID=1872709 RepID=UPI0013C311BB|nr:CGNR zinc finger domain-containing protein [Allorhizocola rhizosphaerae]
MTLESDPITSQRTLNSYVANWADLALRLVNELATGWARGRPHPPPTDAAAILRVIRPAQTLAHGVHIAPLTEDDALDLAATVTRLRAAIDACVDGEVQDAAEILNEVMAANHAVPNLHRHPGMPFIFAFHTGDHTGAQARAADMAASLALVIGSGREARLRRCEAARCDRVFYDTTRNASRRFCDLQCQNRAKASAHRARRASTLTDRAE